MTEEREDEARELLEHRDDPDEWSTEPESIEVVKPLRSEVVSFRLPAKELDALEDAAARTGESISEFVRRALALRLYGELIGPSIEISSGASRLVVQSHIIVAGRKDAPASFVQDVPPLTAASV